MGQYGWRKSLKEFAGPDSRVVVGQDNYTVAEWYRPPNWGWGKLGGLACNGGYYTGLAGAAMGEDGEQMGAAIGG